MCGSECLGLVKAHAHCDCCDAMHACVGVCVWACIRCFFNFHEVCVLWTCIGCMLTIIHVCSRVCVCFSQQVVC